LEWCSEQELEPANPYESFHTEPDLLEKYLRSCVHFNEHMFKKMNFITSKSLHVLHFLLSDPIEQFYEREIARQTNVSIGAVNQFLREFHKIGLVDVQKRGKINLYKADLKNPASRQFKVLFNVLALNDLVDEIKQISDRVVLFGSCAEGTDVKDSDIDIFILTSDPETARREVTRYEKKMYRRISPIIVDSTELAKMRIRDKPLSERISRGITLWERE
jgi:predicted nucleotidyltransferase